MSTKRSLVEILHDEWYGEELLVHINIALKGKDMIAERIIEQSWIDAEWPRDAAFPLRVARFRDDDSSPWVDGELLGCRFNGGFRLWYDEQGVSWNYCQVRDEWRF